MSSSGVGYRNHDFERRSKEKKFAAIYARQTWLVIPAIIIWLNGVLLQFCALTDLWEMWAVLWTVEPLAVGLALLVVGGKTRSNGLLVAGLIVCGLAGLALIGMTTAFSEWRLVSLLGSTILIFMGILLLIWGMIRRSPSTSSALE
jgi:hypothetical protein